MLKYFVLEMIFSAIAASQLKIEKSQRMFNNSQLTFFIVLFYFVYALQSRKKNSGQTFKDVIIVDKEKTQDDRECAERRSEKWGDDTDEAIFFMNFPLHR